MSYTRRGAIALMVGGGVWWASETGAFSSAEADRSATMSSGPDETALLGIQGIDSQPVEEGKKITLANRTQSRLDVVTKSQKFNFSTSPLELNSGQSGKTSVSIASDKTGTVSDTIQFLAKSPEGGSTIRVQVARQLTVQSDSPGPVKGQLVYAVKNSPSNGDIRVYDPVNGTVNDLPQSESASAIGDGADIVGGSAADIPYLSKQGSNRIYATTVGNSEDTKIPKSNSTKPKIRTSNTRRIAIGEWPPAKKLSGKLILAGSNKKNIAGVDADGNPEVIAELGNGNGCSDVLGVADIDGDGSDEIIYSNTSQQIYYLNQDEDDSTEEIPNAGAGANSGGVGIGPPADFNGDGVPRVPFIDGSNQVALITADGIKTTVTGEVAQKAGITPVDIDDDGNLELAFFGNTTGGDKNKGKIRYVDNVLKSNQSLVTLTTSDGSTISPNRKIGLGFSRR